MKKILKRTLPLLLIGLLMSCGEKLDIYNWTKIRIYSHDSSKVEDIPTEGSVELDNYAIRLEFTPEAIISVSSSDWVNASSAYQSNDKIVSLEIRSVNTINENIGPDEILNEVFRAGPIGATSSELRSIEDYIEAFGSKSGEVDSEFALYLTPGLTVIDDFIQLNVLVELQNGGSLGSKTDKVTLIR
ncbi:hypothetical protein R9C00_07975 [Flammeovirgaceae bacterium SG7u.111]|nr:hypothetical protein [Flammeovirgaceae bacterium SG7u.132]WPO37384.1 hypothetical protein R9C00_07975 [Flammeovirgaceae bacterium SG7u.111]